MDSEDIRKVRAHIHVCSIAETDNEVDRAIVGKGYLPDSVRNDYKEYLTADNYDKSPLTQLELMTYSSWFLLHPEKVAGEVEYNTSFQMPIIIKGGKEEINSVLKLKEIGEILTIMRSRIFSVRYMNESFEKTFRGGNLSRFEKIKSIYRSNIKDAKKNLRNFIASEITERKESECDGIVSILIDRYTDEIDAEMNEMLAKEREERAEKKRIYSCQDVKVWERLCSCFRISPTMYFRVIEGEPICGKGYAENMTKLWGDFTDPFLVSAKKKQNAILKKLSILREFKITNCYALHNMIENFIFGGATTSIWYMNLSDDMKTLRMEEEWRDYALKKGIDMPFFYKE